MARNVERDEETGRMLEAAGWQLLVVWEHEDAVAAADRVVAALVAG